MFMDDDEKQVESRLFFLSDFVVAAAASEEIPRDMTLEMTIISWRCHTAHTL